MCQKWCKFRDRTSVGSYGEIATNEAMCIFWVCRLAGTAAGRAPASRGAAPLRSRSPWRPAQMTYRSRGGARGALVEARGGAAPPAAPPSHTRPCRRRHSTVGPCKMTDVKFGYTSLEGNDIFIKMKMR